MKKPVLFLMLSLMIVGVYSAESLVADPGRGSKVERNEIKISGRDFWYLLIPQWHQLDGVKDESFVQESGLWRLKWQKKGNWDTNLPRVLLLRELKVYMDDSGRTVEESINVKITANEVNSQIYHPEYLTDGDLKTVCAISGDINSPAIRFDPVRAEIEVKTARALPLKKVTLAFGVRKNSELGEVAFFVNGEELKPETMEITNGVMTAIFSSNPPTDNFTVRCESTPYKVKLEDFQSTIAERCRKYPFSSYLYRPVPFGMKPENFDRPAAEKLLKKYEDNHIGIAFGEWDSQAFFQSWNSSSMFYQELTEFFGPEPDNRYNSEKTLHKFWDWHKSIFFDRVWGMSGAIGFPHYGMEWGGKVAGMELTNHTSTIPHRTLMRYTAGAGRQYGKPWLLYLAYYLGRFSPDSTKPMGDPKSKSWTDGPDAGISPSFSRRVFLTAYFMGANFLSFEAQPWGMANRNSDGSASLNPNGKVLKEFYEWVRSPAGKRGDWYTPILLLNDYHHGLMRRNGKIWGYNISMEKGDWMGEHFRRAIDYYDGQSQAWDKPPYSHNMHNSPLGDIFDTAFGNPPSKIYPKFAEYPVVILTDDIRIDSGLNTQLEKYVIGGGTLVINSIHQKALPGKMIPGQILPSSHSDEGMTIPKLKPGKYDIVMKSASGLPLAIKSRYGNGNVIMTLPEYLLGADQEQPTPYIGKLLESLQREVMPFQIDGDVQFLLSRLNGETWKLALLNNKGVLKKPWDREEKYDPAYTTKVTVKLPSGAEASEVYQGIALQPDSNKITMEIPPGEVRVLEIRNAPMKSVNSLPLIGEWKLDGNTNNSIGKSREKAYDVRFTETASGQSVYDVSMPLSAIMVDYNPGYRLIAGTFEFWAAPNLEYKLSDRGGYPLSSRFFRVYMNGKWGLVIRDSYVIQGPEAVHREWTHLAFTWDDRECRFFVNGVEYTNYGVPIKEFLPIWNNTFQIGTYGRGRRTFGGQISNVKLYSRALSGEEIKTLYEQNKNKY